MTSKDQNRMAPSSQVESFMASIRRNTSGTYEGNYGDRGQGVGAYDIKPQNWRAYALAAGLPNANWRDPRAQDAVARAKMQRDFERYGNWQLVAVAWYAGTEAADAVQQRGKVDDASIRRVLGADTADYVSDVVRNSGEIDNSEWGGTSGNTNLMLDTNMAMPGATPQEHSSTRAEDMVRDRLMGLAEMGVSSDASEPEPELEPEVMP